MYAKSKYAKYGLISVLK